MAGVLTRRKESIGGEKHHEIFPHIKTEAEIEVVDLQATGSQGLLATARRWGEA